MTIVYSPRYEVNLGRHVFPIRKYRLIKERLIADGVVAESDFVEPLPANEDDILLVHTREYMEKVKNVSFSPKDTMLLEVFLTEELARLVFLSCGGTILACRTALEQGIGLHCGGGSPHAFPDRGEGFCVFNDIAISIRVLQKEEKIARAMVIDCDVHQGNGTAHIFKNDPSVFAFSIHQEAGSVPAESTNVREVALKRHTGDKEYLNQLRKNIPAIIEEHRPDLVIYVAGADPYEDDQLGELNISMEGLRQRDLFIQHVIKKHSIPTAVVLAGGYARKLEDTVAIQAMTLRIFTDKETE